MGMFDSIEDSIKDINPVKDFGGDLFNQVMGDNPFGNLDIFKKLSSDVLPDSFPSADSLFGALPGKDLAGSFLGGGFKPESLLSGNPTDALQGLFKGGAMGDAPAGFASAFGDAQNILEGQVPAVSPNPMEATNVFNIIGSDSLKGILGGLGIDLGGAGGLDGILGGLGDLFGGEGGLGGIGDIISKILPLVAKLAPLALAII